MKNTNKSKSRNFAKEAHDKMFSAMEEMIDNDMAAEFKRAFTNRYDNRDIACIFYKNGKLISKTVASALQEQLGKLFPDFVKASKSIPANSDFERRYKANMRYVKETKRIDFGLNSTINFGFDVYISNPCFYINGSDHPDEPFITLEFSNLQCKIDPKNLAKIILFGLSTDFIYRVVLENDKNEEIVMAYAIDKIDMDTFYKINVYFKYLGDFKDLGLEEEK